MSLIDILQDLTKIVNKRKQFGDFSRSNQLLFALFSIFVFGKVFLTPAAHALHTDPIILREETHEVPVMSHALTKAERLA